MGADWRYLPVGTRSMKRLQAIFGTARGWSAGMLSSIISFASLRTRRGLAHMAGVERRDRVGPLAILSTRPIPAATPAAVTTFPERTTRSSGLERLERALATERQFAAISAHELRKPIAAPRPGA